MFSSIQQSYERRGKVVKDGKEAKLWSEVSTEMMSDEEREGEGYVRHQPHYIIIKKLDSRLDSTKGIEKHPRMDRRVGSPHEKPIPEGCKKWIVKKSLIPVAEVPDTESEGVSSGSGSESEELFNRHYNF